MNLTPYQPLENTPSAKEKISPLGLPLLSREKFMLGSNSALVGIGTTAGIIAEGLWYATSSITTGGLGLSLSTTLALSLIGVVGIVCVGIATPIAILAYRDLINDAKKLNQDIANEITNRIQLQEKIFFECLKLRAAFDSDEAFNESLSKLHLPHPSLIKPFSLCALTNQIYHQLNKQQFEITWDFIKNKPSLFRTIQNKNSISLKKLLNDTPHIPPKIIRKELIHAIKTNETDGFSNQLANCFHDINLPTTTSYSKAGAYGGIAGLSLSGFALSTSWAFAALMVGAGISLAIPFLGWAILGAACISAGVIFGLGIGLSKKRNLLRTAMQNHLDHDNQQLDQFKKTIETEKMKLALTSVKQPSEKIETKAQTTSPLSAKVLMGYHANQLLHPKPNVEIITQPSPSHRFTI